MKKEYKSSQFNEYLGRGKEGWVIFNNLSSAMIEVPKRIYDAISKDRLDILSDDVLFGLKKGHFIVSDNDNEIDILKKKREELYESSAVIGLQILPTLGCNFRCIYCYENSQSNTELMSKEVMDAIINYVKKTIKSTTRLLNVSWYGGEPLLGMRQIEYLSSLFIDICNKYNVEYFSHIVTNGYLLTSRNIESLKRFRINQAQVTIDGPEDVHDKRRMLKNGKGTYKRILSNLKDAISENMDIKIRVNLDKTNIHAVADLLENLQKDGILDKARISFGLVSDIGSACRSIEENLLTREEAIDIIRDYKLEKFLRDYREVIRPVPHLLGCVAQTKTSLIIGPDGEIYKCSKVIGDKKEMCGTIFNVDYTHPNWIKWAKEDKLEIKKCQRCSMIPVCDGDGCPYDFLKKEREKNECDQAQRHKNYLEMLKFLYQRRYNFKGLDPLKFKDERG